MPTETRVYLTSVRAINKAVDAYENVQMDFKGNCSTEIINVGTVERARSVKGVLQVWIGGEWMMVLGTGDMVYYDQPRQTARGAKEKQNERHINRNRT